MEKELNTCAARSLSSVKIGSLASFAGAGTREWGEELAGSAEDRRTERCEELGSLAKPLLRRGRASQAPVDCQLAKEAIVLKRRSKHREQLS